MISVIALISVFPFTGARAQPVTASNEPAGYSRPHCEKPELDLIAPKSEHTDHGWVQDNKRVMKFNKEALTYNSCMRSYLDSASRDLKIVQDKANSDLKLITENANKALKDIERKARDAANEASEVKASQEKAVADAKRSK
jgi:hypothetical protein